MPPEFLLEVTTVGGSCLRFGPYEREAAQQMVDEFQLHLGHDEVAFASAVDEQGVAVGAWTFSARSIAGVRLLPSSACPDPVSGRLQGRRWSRSYVH